MTKTAALTLQKEQFEEIVGSIGHYTEVTSHILQTHTDHEVVAFGRLIPTELLSTIKKVQTMSLTPNEQSDIDVCMKTESIAKQLSKFGRILQMSSSPSSSVWTSSSVAKVDTKFHVKVESKTSKGEGYPRGGAEVKGVMRSKAHNGAVVYGEVEDHRDGTYTITLTPQTAGPHQLVITMDGQHVQSSPHDLDVKSKDLSYHTLYNIQQEIEFSNFGVRLFCVAIDSNGALYVGCSDNCIYVIENTGEVKSTIGSYGRGDGQFNKPFGISIKGNVLYVADFHNHRIQKLTSRGEFLHKFGQQGTGQGQFNGPWGIVISSDNRLIISDYDNHRIQIFDEDGGWLLTIDGNSSGNHAFLFPRGLALDPQGNIHIAAYGSNTMKVFTKEGVYVRMYGDVKNPVGVAIDSNGYSFVPECSSNCLSIFDPEGKKIHTVERLKKPSGIVLDSRDGRVYIANNQDITVVMF